ncbi:MAG: alpha/beta hydrolase [Thermoguttaceae bacterium]
MSHLSRTSKLVAKSPWLPLRESLLDYSKDIRGGEAVDFTTPDNIVLKGTYFKHKTEKRKGLVLFLHELNGDRWSANHFIDILPKSGFDLFTFDQRGHGESDSFLRFQQTPRITNFDLLDVQGAVDYISSRKDYQNNTENNGFSTDSEIGKGIGVLGHGKGATLALCSASTDNRIVSVIMDCPVSEEILYEKNCLNALKRSSSLLFTRRLPLSLTLSLKAILYLIACPFFSLHYAWRRFMLGLWYGGCFVNSFALVKKLRKPILILHENLDSCVSLEQIHAFGHKMPIRPKIWMVSDSSDYSCTSFERQIVSFLAEA